MSGGVERVDGLDGGFPSSQLEHDGELIRTGAPVTGVVGLGEVIVTAHGDGGLRFFGADQPPVIAPVHDGVILSMARAGADRVVTGGEDGAFRETATDGTTTLIARLGRRWVDCVAAHPRRGHKACSVGGRVSVWIGAAPEPVELEHPSTVAGLAFDPTGKRLAVAHYGGVTLWTRTGTGWRPDRLEWAGSHVSVAWSPDGAYVVSAMQENALHGWRLQDSLHMTMSGYPAKPRASAWVGSRPYLATSGADQIVAWPFDGEEGPMGRAPLAVNYAGPALVSAVNGLPGTAVVFAGLDDGAVLMSDLEAKPQALVLRGTTGEAVTGVGATPSLSHLLVGDSAGTVLWAPLKA